MPFRYLRDPLFIFCMALYFVNRLIFKKIWPSGFVHEHLNDLICIPFWVPIMLFAQRLVRLRAHDDPPLASELIIPLVIWSFIFEILLPATQWLGGSFVADYWDVFYYALGTLVGALWWRWWYGRRATDAR
jgi:hypothetical protein